jgi:hypothetical protein
MRRFLRGLAGLLNGLAQFLGAFGLIVVLLSGTNSVWEEITESRSTEDFWLGFVILICTFYVCYRIILYLIQREKGLRQMYEQLYNAAQELHLSTIELLECKQEGSRRAILPAEDRWQQAVLGLRRCQPPQIQTS